VDLARIGSDWPESAGYLDTATYGLPPRRTLGALRGFLGGWAAGELDWQRAEAHADEARRVFARLVATRATNVALVPSASVAAAVAAETVHDGEILLCPDDHPSVTLPMLGVAQKRRLTIREAPFDRLPAAVRPGTRLIACSHVHHADGRVADLRELVEAGASVGAATYVDATQSVGMLPVEVDELGLDYLGCAAYKWLCCPRGAGFLSVHPRRHEYVLPLAPSRRATLAPLHAQRLSDTELAEDAAKLDLSLGWLAWIGARTSLEAIVELSAEDLAESVGLASRLAEHLGVDASGSAICAIAVRDVEEARRRLDVARIRVSTRQGRIRVSPHFYNSRSEIDRVADVLEPLIVER
jgi:selenocysteine lyase/cysteine desulfurase